MLSREGNANVARRLRSRCSTGPRRRRNKFRN